MGITTFAQRNHVGAREAFSLGRNQLAIYARRAVCVQVFCHYTSAGLGTRQWDKDALFETSQQRLSQIS